ncbi:hypothetical protein NVP2275O_426 [Vibrio phage 2.275.O._10N.286.54.E11]|nr:hypothetical protein NVP2275O_426 [Vibrio phage 2.275.O._10N.286.54.E11]
MAVFRGFASPAIGNTVTLQDVDLVKRDLLNHFYTRKGEKAMNQDYGFIGWDLLFELERPNTQSLLETDTRRIIQTDPRVEEVSITIELVPNGYNIVVRLNFLVLDTVDELYISFNQNMIDMQS